MPLYRPGSSTPLSRNRIMRVRIASGAPLFQRSLPFRLRQLTARRALLRAVFFIERKAALNAKLRYASDAV